MAHCPRCGAELVPPYRYCPGCGQVPPAPTPHAYPYPYPYYPQPRKDNAALIIVLVVVLVIVLPVVLSAVLYVMVSGLISTPATTRPVITLALNSDTAASADILIAGAQPAASASNFRVNLEVGSAFGIAAHVGIPAGTPAYVAVGNATYTITWQNPGGSGSVVAGDHFVIAYPTPAFTGTSMTFVLLWPDGTTVATLGWTTP